MLSRICFFPVKHILVESCKYGTNETITIALNLVCFQKKSQYQPFVQSECSVISILLLIKKMELVLATSV